METQFFRANAAALIRSRDGRLLACQRDDYPENWQCPQGGINVGDDPEMAVWREIKEEVGLNRDHLELVDRYPSLLSYKFPLDVSRDNAMGQTQQWFLFDFTGSESAIVLDEHEFRAWEWQWMDELVDKVHPMKRGVMETLQGWLENLR